MKCAAEKVVMQPAFQPVRVEFTLETAAEVQALYDLTNYGLQAAGRVASYDHRINEAAICCVLHDIGGVFRQSVGRLDGNGGSTRIHSNGEPT